TYSASYDQRIAVGRYDFFGVGGSFWGDVAGESDFSTLQGKLSASYSKRMGGYRSRSHYLVVGADAGITQRSVDFAKLRWPSQHDGNGGFNPDADTGEGNITYRPDFIWADIAAGLLWFTVLDDNNNFYVGGAYHHLNRANISFNENEFESLYSRFTIHAGGEFMLADRFGLVPGVITMIQGPSFQTNVGTSLKFLLSGNKRNYQAFHVGTWFRLSNHFQSEETTDKLTKDALIISTRFDYQDFSLGFSYDLNVSKLFPATNGNGSFEFSIIYKICGAEKRNVYCPNF
ncbi:MAG: PorP/SprF family type IX secretion system membrane protein, partial [Saprospiraceae bacterium]|nr:PorP/SprF family type IX secretion system membrane protein [Saprospiraceae bacterium]